MGNPFIIIDEITDEITSAKTEILNKIESVNSTIQVVNNANLINSLLSDSVNANKWALRQTGVGAALNDAFDMNNSTLAGLSTASAIAANKSVLLAIVDNTDAYNVCKNNTTIANAINNISDETYLVNGYGYKMFNVGDTVSLNYGGTATTFRVVHKNYKTTNKIVLLSENILVNYKWDSSNNNYSESDIRTYLNGTVLGKFSSAIQNAIVTTSVACHNNSTAVTCKDKIWLPSYAEVGLGTHNYAPVEGSCFSYFSTDATNRRIKKLNGTANYWWLRTPYSGDSYIAWRVGTDGSGNRGGVTNSYGVVPAFEI